MVKADELLEFLKEQNKNFMDIQNRHLELIDKTIRQNQTMIEDRNKEIDNILKTTKEDRDETLKHIKNIGNDIIGAHEETRNMIDSKYDVFGKSMTVLIALMIGMFSYWILSAKDSDEIGKSIIAIFISIVTGHFINTKNKKTFEEFELKKKTTT